MPRNHKSELSRNRKLDSEKMTIVVSGWVRGVKPAVVVDYLDKTYPEVKGKKKHVIRREAISNYYRDIGNIFWVVKGYELCWLLFNLSVFHEKPKNSKEIDPYIREALELIWDGLSQRENFVLNTRISPETRAFVSTFLSGNSTSKITEIAEFLFDSFRQANGFIDKRLHAYFGRALALGYFCGTNKQQLSKKEKLEEAQDVLFHMTIETLNKYPLGTKLPLSTFPWANDPPWFN